jgi:dodecin
MSDTTDAWEVLVDEHIYKVVRLVGSSPESIEDAIQQAVRRAAATLRHMRWFEVVETRGHIDGDAVRHYQVTLDIGFTLEDEARA